jgi:hypothetical protein
MAGLFSFPSARLKASLSKLAVSSIHSYRCPTASISIVIEVNSLLGTQGCGIFLRLIDDREFVLFSIPVCFQPELSWLPRLEFEVPTSARLRRFYYCIPSTATWLAVPLLIQSQGNVSQGLPLLRKIVRMLAIWDSLNMIDLAAQAIDVPRLLLRLQIRHEQN